MRILARAGPAAPGAKAFGLSVALGLRLRLGVAPAGFFQVVFTLFPHLYFRTSLLLPRVAAHLFSVLNRGRASARQPNRRRALALVGGLLGLLLGLAAPARAQTAQEPFGRVRIQYKNFDWAEYSTQNFNVYFYAGGQASARRVAEYAEQELQRITALVGYFPYSKTTLMLYNSVGDLRQSNIGLPSPNSQNAANAQLAQQTRVEIAFTGRETDFKRELSYQLTQVLLNDMLYGGSLREVLQSNYLLQLPEWFVSGAAAYASEGWSVDMDAYMRDMVRQYPSGNRTAPFFLRSPRLAGHSIWNYIAERYGYGTVQNVLNLTRITRDVEVGIASSLNVPYKVFLRDWVNYYRNINTGGTMATLTVPNDKNRLSSRNRRGLDLFSQPVFSPDGQHLAFAVNDQGRYRVVVTDRAGRHPRTILHGGYRTPDQTLEARLPVLAWRNNAQLAVGELVQGRMALRVREALGLDLPGRLRRTFQLHPPVTIFAAFDQVLDMNYSPDGKALVFSAIAGGQNDLYLLRAGSRQPERLTNDLFDDQQAVFSPNGQEIVFSSNRYLDSAGRARPATFNNVVNNYDLFVYHLDGREIPVTPLVSTISNETRPRFISDDEVLYLSEESGIRSLFRYSRKTGERQPASNFASNIQDFDYNPATKGLGFVAQVQARDLLYLYQQYELPTGLPVGKTSRQRILESRSAPAPIRPAKPAPTGAAAGTTAATSGAAGSSPGAVADTARAATPTAAATPAAAAPKRRAGTVNTGNYQFEEDDDEVAPTRPRRSPIASTARTPARPGPTAITGPFRYDTRFMADNLTTGVAVDPLLGFGLSLQANLSDALENQRIQASIFGQLDLRTSNISFIYTNVTHRLDWSLAYRKQAYFFDASTVNGALGGEQVRYGRHSFSPTATYPFTHNLSLRAGPRYDNISRTLTGSSVTDFDLSRNYLGYNAELVFDNSLATGENMLQGTRMKIGVEQMRDVKTSANSFGKLYIDLRHYQKLHRSLVWANRVSYGQFFGANQGTNTPQTFRLGGMDNWIGQKYSDSQLLTPSGQALPDPTNIFYQQFVTNLRGYNLSKRVGSRYLLLNSELRLPIVQFLTNGPINSGFFRNLQLTSFFDAGTAYEGTNPFSEDNSNVTSVSAPKGNPFSATIINYNRAILFGYGGGVRTTLLGFYVKFDLAWSLESYVTSGPKPYATLGYDF